MRQPYVEATIRAEIDRASKAGYDPCRRYLMAETGLDRAHLEAAISRIAKQMLGESGGD